MTNLNGETIACSSSHGSTFELGQLEKYFDKNTINSLRGFSNEYSYDRRYEYSDLNTDNAWIEIEIISYHYESEEYPIRE